MTIKFTLIMIAALSFASCGDGEMSEEDKQKKVCSCSKAYDEMYDLSDKLEEEEGLSMTDAKNQAEEQLKDALNGCEEFHKEVGDEGFYELSQKCDHKN